MTAFTAFSELLTGYRAFAFDAYGVLVDARGPLAGSAALLAELTRAGTPWVVCTNDASRSPESVARRWADGVVPADRVITAGLLAQEELSRAHAGEAVGLLGPPASGVYLERAGCRIVDLDRAAEADLEGLAAICLMDESGFDWQVTLDRVVNLLRRRPDLPLVVPNPDPVFPRGDGTFGIGAGAVAALIEAATGCRTLRLGKPAPALFERALARLRQDAGDLEPAEVLFVGDTLATDVVGAASAGLGTCLVLSGNTPAEGWQRAVAAAARAPDWVCANACSVAG